MPDKFIPAVQELGEAISTGEPVDRALAEIAAEHGLKPEALRNRAERSLGDLTTYRERNAPRIAAAAELAQKERDWAKARRIMISRAAERGETMSETEADGHIRFFGVEYALRTETRGFQPTNPTWDDE